MKTGRMMYILWTVVGVVVMGLATMTIFVGCKQAKYVYYPDRSVDATPADVGLEFEDLTLRTRDGESIKAWYVPGTVGGEAAAHTILFCHGNAGDMGDRVGSLLTFNTLGFSTLIFDYRGYGESSGTPTEQGTYLDAQACWDYLVNDRDTAPLSIVVFGGSLGGAVASQLATHTTPGALVLDSVFSSVPDMAARMFPLLPISRFCRFSYDNEVNVAKVQCPVMVAHSRSDATCPFDQGVRVFEAASEPKQFVELEGAHSDGGLTSNPRYQVALVAFLSKHL